MKQLEQTFCCVPPPPPPHPAAEVWQLASILLMWWIDSVTYFWSSHGGRGTRSIAVFHPSHGCFSLRSRGSDVLPKAPAGDQIWHESASVENVRDCRVGSPREDWLFCLEAGRLDLEKKKIGWFFSPLIATTHAVSVDACSIRWRVRRTHRLHSPLARSAKRARNINTTPLQLPYIRELPCWIQCRHGNRNYFFLSWIFFSFSSRALNPQVLGFRPAEVLPPSLLQLARTSFCSCELNSKEAH